MPGPAFPFYAQREASPVSMPSRLSGLRVNSERSADGALEDAIETAAWKIMRSLGAKSSAWLVLARVRVRIRTTVLRKRTRRADRNAM